MRKIAILNTDPTDTDLIDAYREDRIHPEIYEVEKVVEGARQVIFYLVGGKTQSFPRNEVKLIDDILFTVL